MPKVPKDILEMVNAPGRLGILCTVSADGQPNAAYFGSAGFRDDQTLSVGLMGGRTLDNLKANPKAVFMCLQSSPVSFNTPGCRIYLKVKLIETRGDLINQIKKEIAERFSQDAANAIQAAVAFEVTEVRKVVDMGG